MPELPEVEITARRLRTALPSRQIRRLDVPDPHILGSDDPVVWQTRLVGARFLQVRRRAKFLLLDLDNEETLLAHLGMTGKLEVQPSPPPSYLRFVALLTDGMFLCFQDPRRLGQLRLVATPTLDSLPKLERLGPDALEDPSPAARLAALGSRSRRPIKAWLMDQQVLGGLGNICAAEILFRVGLPPERPASELTPPEWERLAAAIPAYLRWAIDAQWDRPMKYLGERDAENPFALYRRAGAPCPRCGAPIRRIVLGGRGTYVCRECQA